MEFVLRALAGRRVLIHGCGAHSRSLEAVFRAAPVEIVAFADEDSSAAQSSADDHRSSWLLGLPVVLPADAASTRATDVVLSSWLHEAALWSRRAVYEQQGIKVHRLYDDTTSLRRPA
jgi:hypothetical protein